MRGQEGRCWGVSVADNGRSRGLTKRGTRCSRQVAHLEELVEGLQDALHRESVRRDHEASEVQRKWRRPSLRVP
jgi:hypothetical protein